MFILIDMSHIFNFVVLYLLRAIDIKNSIKGVIKVDKSGGIFEFEPNEFIKFDTK
tara:strand:+ start:359 stop:523 length:165 start_codon:yes stop_codon:yes gene_type:complete